MLEFSAFCCKKTDVDRIEHRRITSLCLCIFVCVLAFLSFFKSTYSFPVAYRVLLLSAQDNDTTLRFPKSGVLSQDGKISLNDFRKMMDFGKHDDALVGTMLLLPATPMLPFVIIVFVIHT